MSYEAIKGFPGGGGVGGTVVSELDCGSTCRFASALQKPDPAVVPDWVIEGLCVTGHTRHRSGP